MSLGYTTRMMWSHSSASDKFLTIAMPLAPILIPLNSIYGPNPPSKVFWVIYPFALTGILAGWLGILLGIYRECKEKERKQTQSGGLDVQS